MTNQNTIATTLLEQLTAGRLGRFVAMTGARNMLLLDDGISFKLPRGMGPYRYVRIVLDASDTYTIDLGRIYRYEFKVAKSIEMVYADALRACFARETGLDLSL